MRDVHLRFGIVRNHRVATRSRRQVMVLGVSRSSRIFPWSWFPLSGIKRSSVCSCGLPPGDVMEPWSEPTKTVWPFPFPPQDWEQTPLAVQAYVRTLRGEVVQLHDRRRS